MQLAVLGTEEMRKELATQGVADNMQLHFFDTLPAMIDYPADAYIDLLFEPDQERINVLKQLNKLIVINSVITTLGEISHSFIRINAWPGFLKAPVLEGAGFDNESKLSAEIIFQHLNKKIEWLPDEPGFITPRVVSMIINEAYFALSEGVSTKEEIDTAMKLGTAYPYGPFEWSRKIGLKNIADLLQKLAVKLPRYQPAALLLKEAEPDIL